LLALASPCLSPGLKGKKTKKLYSGEPVKDYSGFERLAIRRLLILDRVHSLDDLNSFLQTVLSP
jgi:hypothetical protein